MKLHLILCDLMIYVKLYIYNLPRIAILGTMPIRMIVGVTEGAAVRVTAHLANVAFESTVRRSSTPMSCKSDSALAIELRTERNITPTISQIPTASFLRPLLTHRVTVLTAQVKSFPFPI